MFFYLDHLYPTSELLLQASKCGDLPPGIGAQTRPFEPLCQETMMGCLCKFFGLRILYVESSLSRECV